MIEVNKTKHARLKIFTLRLSNGIEVVLRDIKVIKDSQRHIARLEGNPSTVTLFRIKNNEKRDFRSYAPEGCVIYAYSNDIGLEGIAVAEIPQFIERLLM